MKKIPLTRGKFALVDDEDFEWLNQWKWRVGARRNRSTIYAVRAGRKAELKCTYFMHRIVTDCPDGLQVDHINHDGLDNRRENLRVCTRNGNQWNRRKTKARVSSIYKGVCSFKKTKKWRALIKINGKKIYLGLFKQEIDAAKAYDTAAKKYFGEFAYLNFPEKADKQ